MFIQTTVGKIKSFISFAAIKKKNFSPFIAPIDFVIAGKTKRNRHPARKSKFILSPLK